MSVDSLKKLKASELSKIKLAQYPVVNIADNKLQWAVIVARYKNQWLFVKHRARTTLESPGGKREPGETIVECAQRELYEETGATEFSLEGMPAYSIQLPNGDVSYGQLFFAQIQTLGPLPSCEIDQVVTLDGCPDFPTYPQVHPFLLSQVTAKLGILQT